LASAWVDTSCVPKKVIEGAWAELLEFAEEDQVCTRCLPCILFNSSSGVSFINVTVMHWYGDVHVHALGADRRCLDRAAVDLSRPASKPCRSIMGLGSH